MAKPYYLGILSNQDVVKVKAFNDPMSWSFNTHMDYWPFDTHDLSRHWRIAKGAIQFDDTPTLDTFFKTMDWAHSEGVKITTLQFGWHGRLQPASSFDPRQLQEKRMPKVSRKSLTLQEVKLPLAEIGLTGPTRMEVQRRFNVHRSTGATIQGAIRRVEMELGITELTVDAAGKDVVFFKNPDDSFTMHEAVEKPAWVDDDRKSFRFGDYVITGTNKEHARIAFQAAVAYSEEGREEEYAKVKAGRWSVAGRPVRIRKKLNEVWRSMIGVGEWAAAHPGYDFRIIAHTPTGRQIIDTTPNLKVARKLAKDYYRRTKTRVEVLDAKDRRYFLLGN